MREQTPPFAVQVELVEGCNLACSFCGINGIREHAGGPYNFMTEKTAGRIAYQIYTAGWNPRVEFAMHGEPTMHPEVVARVKQFRTHLPKQQLMMTSNGGGLLRDISLIDQLFDAGLNLLVLDDYKTVKIVPKLLERYKGSRPVFEYPANLEAAPHRRWPRGTQAIIRVADLWTSDNEKRKGTHTKVDNHAGCAEPPPVTPLAKRCAKPFREMSFRWDGKVALCCDSWRGEYYCGDINKAYITEIWNSPEFQAARRKLYAKERTFDPCRKCDKVSYRTHWLPDPKGNETLPAPTAEDEALIKSVSRRKLLSTVVLRPWEKQK